MLLPAGFVAVCLTATYENPRQLTPLIAGAHHRSVRRSSRPAAAHGRVAAFVVTLALAVVVTLAAVSTDAQAIPDPSVPYPPQSLTQTCTEISWGRDTGHQLLGALCAVASAVWMTMLEIDARTYPRI